METELKSYDIYKQHTNYGLLYNYTAQTTPAI